MAQANPAAAVSNIRNTPELWDKITFTFLCLLIYRIGAHITVPGVDVVALTDFFANQGKGGLLGLYDLFVGGGLSRATVFALGIMPYISASIFVQIAGAFRAQAQAARAFVQHAQSEGLNVQDDIRDVFTNAGNG